MSVNTKLANALAQSAPKEAQIEQTETLNKQMVWDRTLLDFGIVAPGSKQKYSFQYLGTETIAKVKAGCGCTTAYSADNEVTGVLSLGKDFSYAKDNLIGQVKTVSVELSNGETYTLTLTCKIDKTLDVHNNS